MKKWVEHGHSNVEFECSRTKPNIFLIGDSIRQGYCKTVKESLSDVAEVFYFSDNCRSTQYGVFNMKGWAGKFDDPALVDIVHFNFGHWDVAHFNGVELSLTSLEEYGRNMNVLVELIKRFFPNAKLVFATSTPMNPDRLNKVDTNPRSDEELDAYNRVAVEIMQKHEVAVSDLNAYMRGWGTECFSDACHLTPAAFAALGEEVARRLRSFI